MIKVLGTKEHYILFFIALLFSLGSSILTDYALINGLAQESTGLQLTLYSNSISFYTSIFAFGIIYYLFCFGLSIFFVELIKLFIKADYDYKNMQIQVMNGLLVFYMISMIFDFIHDLMIIMVSI